MRYLLATWEGGGNLAPELAVARRLIARGHEVRVLGDPAVEAASLAAGCAFSPWVTAPFKRSLAPEEDLLRDWEIKNPLVLFQRALDVFIAGPIDRYVADTAATLDRHPADAVLADMMMFGAGMVAEARGLPRISLVPNIYMRPARGVPQFGMGAPRARGPLGHARDSLVRWLTGRMWRKAEPAINRARTGLGLAPVPDFWAQCDRFDRVLILTSEAFDFVPRELPANVRYAGAMLDDPSWAGTSWTPPWPAANQDPIVLVGLSSTFQDQLSALRRIAAALAELPVRAVITLGPALSPDAVAAPAPHVAIVPHAPHAAILRDAALAITHCGHGTTMRALAAGVPLVCMPMGRDQGDNAARVVHHGAGVRLKPTASASGIRQAVQNVLSDPRFTAGAKALATAIARDGHALDPAVLVEEASGNSAIAAAS